VYLIPLWGVFQIVVHSTASTIETREQALKWCALEGVFFPSQPLAATRAARPFMVDASLQFAVQIAVLCLNQFFTWEGRVLRLFPSGYPDGFATFQHCDNYAPSLPSALIANIRLSRNRYLVHIRC
jgi:hypothetical protein